MLKALISVIVPVYKVEEKWLRRSIESIIGQTYQNIEIIIVDDGSPDNCGEICEEYASKDIRIHVFHTDNNGVSAARNYALDRANGDYIFFLDSDDSIREDTLEKLYNIMQENSCECIMSSANHVYESESLREISIEQKHGIISYSKSQAIEALCYMKQPYDGFDINTIWGTLYSRECVEGIRFNTHIKIGEDFEYQYKVFQNVKKMACIENKLYNYLIRDNSAMRNGFDKSKLESITELSKLLDSQLVSPQYKEAVRSRVCNIAIVVLFMIPVGKEYKTYRKPIIDFIKENRKSVILNRKTRNKVKISLILSYLGFGFVQRIFQIISRSK